jgi:hypothetical protein
LETDSRAKAERRVLPVVAAWKKDIAAARNELVEDDAAFLRRALRNARDEEHRQSISEQIEIEADDIGSINVENIGDQPSSDPVARRFHGVASGALIQFTEHLDEWLRARPETY